METILESIGHTPLLELKRSVPAGSARIFAKLERFNPSGSLKDRIIFQILTEAERTGRLKPGATVVAGTTGNSGIALALIARVKKYDVILSMPENLSLERRLLGEAYGADVRLTPAAEGLHGALRHAMKIAQEKGAFLVTQFEDPLTVQAHEATAREIEASLVLDVHAVVCSVGTGGSLMGVGQFFKKRGALVVAVEPAASPVISGGRAGPHQIQGIGVGFIPPIVVRELIDEIVTVSDQSAVDAARQIALTEGLLVGISSGAAMVAAKKIAQRLGKGKNVVTLFPDSGERYFSLGYF